MHQGMFRNIIVEALKYFPVCHGGSMTDISACQCLSENQNIREDQIRHETIAGPAKSSRHLIEDQKNTALVTKLSRLL